MKRMVISVMRLAEQLRLFDDPRGPLMPHATRVTAHVARGKDGKLHAVRAHSRVQKRKDKATSSGYAMSSTTEDEDMSNRAPGDPSTRAPAMSSEDIKFTQYFIARLRQGKWLSPEVAASPQVAHAAARGWIKLYPTQSSGEVPGAVTYKGGVWAAGKPANSAVQASPIRPPAHHNASPAKLPGGAWGARVDGEPKVGDTATVTTRAGKSWDAKITVVHGGGLVSTQRDRPTPKRRKSPRGKPVDFHWNDGTREIMSERDAELAEDMGQGWG